MQSVYILVHILIPHMKNMSTPEVPWISFAKDFDKYHSMMRDRMKRETDLHMFRICGTKQTMQLSPSVGIFCLCYYYYYHIKNAFKAF